MSDRPDWQLPIDGLLYGLTFAEEIDDETIDFIAGNAVNRTVLVDGPEVYREAIDEALASGRNLATDGLPRFDHAAIAGFLRAVADRLDALRPWPQPRFRRLDPAEWSPEAFATPIAEFDGSVLALSNLLQEMFDEVDDPEGGRVLMLALDTGETVALLGNRRPRSAVSIHARSGDGAGETIEHFLAATGVPAERLTAI